MKAPAFSFYPGDFLSSPDVSIMNTQEVGAYCLLLFNAWQSERPGYLLNDDRRIQRFTRLSNAEWAECKDAVLAKFPCTDDGAYRYNPRMVMEAQKQQVRREKLAENGKKGGRPKQEVLPVDNHLLSEENQLVSQDNQKVSVENQKQSLSFSISTSNKESSKGESEREVAAPAAPTLFDKIAACRSGSELVQLWNLTTPQPVKGSAEQAAFTKRREELEKAMSGAVQPPAQTPKRRGGPPVEPKPEAAALPLPYPSEAFRREWFQLLLCPNHYKKPVTAHQKVLEKLADLNSEAIAIAAIGEAIAGNYQGVVFDRHKEQAQKLHNNGMVALHNPLAIPQHPDAYQYEIKPELKAQQDAEEQARRERLTQERIDRYNREQQQQQAG